MLSFHLTYPVHLNPGGQQEQPFADLLNGKDPDRMRTVLMQALRIGGPLWFARPRWGDASRLSNSISSTHVSYLFWKCNFDLFSVVLFPNGFASLP